MSTNDSVFISQHAIVRFRERSGFADIEQVSDANIREFVAKLLHRGREVLSSGIVKMRFEIIEASYRTDGEDKTLYFFIKPSSGNKKKKSVVTIFTKRQFGLWIQKLRFVQ